MEFVERYVYVDKTSATVYGNHMKINLSNSMSRVPYTQIEVISAIIDDDVDHQGIVVSLEESAPNFSSSRNKGTVLALVAPDTIQGAKFRYSLSGQGTKPMLYGSLDNLVLTITNSSDAAIVVSSIDAICILFKCSYPRPKEITNTFSEQIPLPSRV